VGCAASARYSSSMRNVAVTNDDYRWVHAMTSHVGDNVSVNQLLGLSPVKLVKPRQAGGES